MVINTLQYDALYTQLHINTLQYDARYTQRHINTPQYDARYTQRHINTLQYDARYTQRHINTLQYDARYTQRQILFVYFLYAPRGDEIHCGKNRRSVKSIFIFSIAIGTWPIDSCTRLTA